MIMMTPFNAWKVFILSLLLPRTFAFTNLPPVGDRHGTSSLSTFVTKQTPFLHGATTTTTRSQSHRKISIRSSSTPSEEEGTTTKKDREEYDIVVIGAGIGGLCCASLLATAGRKVLVLESHYEIGGCAHEYAVDMETGRTIPSSSPRIRTKKDRLFRFEAGPSLYAGLSSDGSPNPLKHVYQMIGEEPTWITYDKWGAFLPEAPDGYELSIGADNFLKILDRYGGPSAVGDWENLARELRPLAQTIMGIPSTALRGDVGILLTLAAKYPKPFFSVIGSAEKIVAPFDLDKLGVKDGFLKNYLDLLAFLLQGLPADQTLTAVMAYMVEDFYREDAVMDYPKDGSKGLVDALARGVTKNPGCEVRTSAQVEEVVVEDGRAVGVRMKNNGEVIRATKAVVSNADLLQTFKFVKTPHEAFDEERERLLGAGIDGKGVPLCKSFMHVHLGVSADLIPEDAPPQWTVVKDWDLGIDAPGNVIVVSCPSKLDPSMAPPGYHVIHAYGAGNEPYEPWERFEHLDAKERSTNQEYQDFKMERSQLIWEAIAKRAPAVTPGVAVVEQIGTPLTHSRFLNRHRGNYGLAIPAGGLSGFKFPEVTTPLPGYYRCGDSTTSGIGVPAVASSGAQCANALLSVWEQLELNKKIKMS
mmetsp:Transcript_33206/g.48739  ORF Transcript_33206/g.48739 Transcript_33206/m.48739 type:complete len:643 (-) Transcript_33206:35-1963(-)